MPSGTFPPTALEAAQHRSVGVPTNHERDRWIEEQREQILVRGDAVATGVRSEATHIVPTHAMTEKELPFRNLDEGGHRKILQEPDRRDIERRHRVGMQKRAHLVRADPPVVIAAHDEHPRLGEEASSA